MGWGGNQGSSQGWGLMPFGGGGSVLQLTNAEAIRENVVRLSFSAAVKFSRLLDPGDGSDAAKYMITAITSTVGSDGLPARSVLVTDVSLVDASTINVGLDRAMSPYPAQYLASVAGLVIAETEEPLDVSASSLLFLGLHQPPAPNLPAIASPRRDVANAEDLQALVADKLSSSSLGVFAPDEGGDYASEMGESSYRGRVFRRVLSDEDGFAHLLGYGCGLLKLTKQLARPALRASFAAKVEAQIRQEPETVQCSASFQQDARDPGTWWLRLRAKANTGESLDELLPLRQG